MPEDKPKITAVFYADVGNWLQFQFADGTRSEVDEIDTDSFVNLAHNLGLLQWVTIRVAILHPNQWITLEKAIEISLPRYS